MRVTYIENEFIASHLCSVTNTLDFENFFETFRNTLNHVVDKSSGGSVEHFHFDGVIGTLDEELFICKLICHVRIETLGQGAFWTFYCDGIAVNYDFDTSWDVDWFFTDS